MAYTVDYKNVSQVGLESSAFPAALAGLRANEARYYMTKYNHVFVVESASAAKSAVSYLEHILLQERKITIASKPLEACSFEVANLRITYVFYESGLAINVMYTLDGPSKRAVGFKLSQGMEIPRELEDKFKFARQKSKLAGEIRGSFFVIRDQYNYADFVDKEGEKQ